MRVEVATSPTECAIMAIDFTAVALKSQPGSRVRQRAIAVASVPSAAQERARRHLVHVVFLVYFLVIFEGALRKWVMPQWSQYLFFIRDPFVLYLYLSATSHRLWPRRSLPLKIGLLMSLAGAVIALLQLALAGFGATQALLAVYGWRNYFFYLPLAFLVGAIFRRSDIARVLRLTLLLAAPLAILVIAQFRSPADAAINVGNAIDTLGQFRGLGLDPEHTRPMATFTSVNGQVMFLASAFAAILAFVVTPAKRRAVGWLVLLIGAAGVLTGVAFSGSRYVLIHCGLAVVGAVILGSLSRNISIKWRAMVMPLAIAVIAAALLPTLFPAGFKTLTDRWTSADKIESEQFGGGVFGRAANGLIDFAPLLTETPLLGYGLGYGGNASTTLGATINGATPLELAESDWARHIVDFGPVFGSAVILLRIVLTFWIGRKVLRHTRRHADAMPILLFAFFGVELLYGQVTGHGTINAYTWLFMGFCIAALGASQQRPPRAGSQHMGRRPGARPTRFRSQAPTKPGAALETQG